jgi:hypothetical protein
MAVDEAAVRHPCFPLPFFSGCQGFHVFGQGVWGSWVIFKTLNTAFLVADRPQKQAAPTVLRTRTQG